MSIIKLTMKNNIQEITKCRHIDLSNIVGEVYTVFVEADGCCHDICEKCFIESNADEINSPNNEASYVSLYSTWES